MHVFLLPQTRASTTPKPCLAHQSMRISIYSTAIFLFLHSSGLSYPCRFYCCLRYAVAVGGLCFNPLVMLCVYLTLWSILDLHVRLPPPLRGGGMDTAPTTTPSTTTTPTTTTTTTTINPTPAIPTAPLPNSGTARHPHNPSTHSLWRPPQLWL